MRPASDLPSLNAVPAAPRSPSPLARELVYSYSGRRGIRLLLGLALLVMGLPFAGLICWDLRRDLAIDLSGETVQGTVLAALKDTSAMIDREHPTLVRFRYSVDGKPYEGETTVRHPEFEKVGSRVTVEHASGIPGFARIRRRQEG